MKSVAYKYRFYPNKKQAALLAQTFGCVRFAFKSFFKSGFGYPKFKNKHARQSASYMRNAFKNPYKRKPSDKY